jgi:DNA-binding CsgD family transcriptional regulator
MREVHGKNHGVRMKLYPREKQILKLIVGGMSYKQISEKLGISYSTVKADINKAKRRNGIDSTFILVLRFAGIN